MNIQTVFSRIHKLFHNDVSNSAKKSEIYKQRVKITEISENHEKQQQLQLISCFITGMVSNYFFPKVTNQKITSVNLCTILENQ